MKKEIARRWPVVAAAALAVGLFAVPGATATVADGGFLIHAENSADPAVGGYAGPIEVSGTDPGTPADKVLRTVECGPLDFEITQSMIDFANSNPGETHRDGWNLLTINGKTPTSADDIDSTIGWLDFSSDGHTVVRYLNNGGSNCELQDYRSTAVGKTVGYELNDYVGNSETRIVEISGTKISERQTFHPQNGLTIDRWDQSQAGDSQRKGNLLQSATIPRSVTPKDKDGDRVLEFWQAWDQKFTITIAADKSVTEVFDVPGSSDTAFDGVRPKSASFDSAGNLLNPASLSEWNASHGVSWDGKPYSYTGSTRSFTSSLS